MAMKLGAAGVLIIFLAVLLNGCLFGGDDSSGGGRSTSVARPGSIPTATPPASLPEPILLGETQGTGARPGTSTSNAAGSYVVKSGDTLGSIAAGQGIAADQQAAWIAEVLRLNGIEDARLLKAGQDLILPRIPTQAAAAATRPAGTGTPSGSSTSTANRTPTPGSSSSSSTPSSGASASPTPRPTVSAGTGSGGAGTYTVQSGDFPLSIAQKLGIPDAQQAAWAAQLITLNNINPSGLQVGQVLQLPPTAPSGGASATSTPVR